eukprot:TRINITY_DN33326_c0_g1_i1.p1 TRINITY_DN33326_c0_g1~~TRINITY_DN33326_c0_g1_i1.p1  ORF type:complete len:113 (+),score=6.27 TRINITY_DN33326_c0_g1_i1:81-419(+)
MCCKDSSQVSYGWLQACSTPMETKDMTSAVDCPSSAKEKAEMILMPYRQVVGSPMYLVVATKPDLVAAVSKAARYMSNPRRRHWELVKRILRYLQRLGCLASPTPMGRRGIL